MTNRIAQIVILFIMLSVMYLLVGHGITAHNGMEIIGFNTDTLIPFIPITVWPYIGIYIILLIIGCVASINADQDTFDSGLRSILIAALFNFALFVLFPMNYPRPEINNEIITSVSPTLLFAWDNLSVSVVSVLYSFDPASCTFPSFHITYPVCFALIFRNKHRKIFWVMTIGTIILLITTWTTKQHFIIDGLAGAITAWVGNRIAFYEW